MNRPKGISDEVWRELKRRYRDAVGSERNVDWQRKQLKKIHDRKYIESLADGYVASCLGVQKKHLTHGLLELKREQLMLRRMVKQLNEEIENGQ